jgi:multiple sugar transport system permease protein
MKKVKFEISKLLSKNAFVLAVIVPTIIFFSIFYYGAVGYAFYISFYKWALREGTFVGLANYIKILGKDLLFYKALGNTFYYTVLDVFVGSSVSLLLAVAVNQVGTVGKVFRGIYFIPYIGSLVATSVIWRWLYQPKLGLINNIIGLLGGSSLMWLESPSLAMLAVIIFSMWFMIGFRMIIFVAALQGIPPVFYEAAEIDGANRWQLFVHITIPLLRPAITFVIVVGMIGALQVFIPMYVLDVPLGGVGSGPLNSTRTIVVHLYERAFTYYQMGYASATAVLLFVIILIFSAVQLRLLQTKWTY